MTNVLRSARNVSFFTLISRTLGLLRDTVCTAYFSAYSLDAFYLAFTIPNLLRRLFGEGAVASSFIPVFAETKERDGIEGAAELTRVTFTTLAAVLMGCLFLLLAASAIARTWLTGPKAELFLRLLDLMLPFLVFVCLSALLGAALNSMGTFGLPALSSAILNVCWIGAVIFLAKIYGIRSAAIGVLIGGFLQMAVLVPPLARHGIRPGLRWNTSHEGLRKITGYTGTVMLGLLLVQINVFVDRIIAETMIQGDGAVTALYLGNRLIQFSYGIFGIAVATAVFPVLAACAARGDMDGLKRSLRQALRIVFFVSVPSAIGLVVLREEIVRLLFQHGEFTTLMTQRTGTVIVYYAAGLWAYCGVAVATRTLYALQHMKATVRVASAMVALNLMLNLILVRDMKEGGLALATAITAAITFVALMVMVTRRIGMIGLHKVIVSFTKTCVSSIAMGLAVLQVGRIVKTLVGVDTTIGRLAVVGTGIGTGMAAFVILSLILGSREIREIANVFSRRGADG